MHHFLFLQEVIEDLENVTVELLKQFYRNLRVKPKKIIMFRDGVSEGQFQQVSIFILFHGLLCLFAMYVYTNRCVGFSRKIIGGWSLRKKVQSG